MLADATNTPALQAHKAHVVSIRSRYHQLKPEELGDIGALLPPAPAEDRAAFYADLQQLPDFVGGQQIRQLLLRQMENTGSRTWLSSGSLASVETLGDPNDSFHVEVFFFASDMGPDQQGAHRPDCQPTSWKG